jgi:hypothetical protein
MKRRDFLKGLGIGFAGGTVAYDLSRKEGIIRTGAKYLISEAKEYMEKREEAHELEVAQELGLISDLGIKVDLGKYNLCGKNIDAKLLVMQNFGLVVSKGRVSNIDELRPKYIRKVMWENGVEIGENEGITDEHFKMLAGSIVENDYTVFLYGDSKGNCLPDNISFIMYKWDKFRKKAYLD